MGAFQSTALKQDEDEEEEEGEESEDEEEGKGHDEEVGDGRAEKKKLIHQMSTNLHEGEKMKDLMDELEQDPEIVPFESSASPASSVNTPHLGPNIRVWDPGHVLNPLPPSFNVRTSFNSSLRTLPSSMVGDEIWTEVYFIRHGESTMNTIPELIGGRSPSAMLTAEGKRQARTLGVFLLSHGLHFDAVFSSPLERCKDTAFAVCQEVNFAKEKIEFTEALAELSQGLWEGLYRSEVYTSEVLNAMSSSQLDFHAPGGESQRQVEFRMIEFLNNVVLPRAVEASSKKHDTVYVRKQSKPNPLMQVHPLNDMANVEEASDMLISHGHSAIKGARKSRLHIASSDDGVITTMEDGASASRPLTRKASLKLSTYNVAVFSHGLAIKCILRGILGFCPQMTHKLCIDNSAMTVLKHSTHQGWQVQRVNDTAHLRLL